MVTKKVCLVVPTLFNPSQYRFEESQRNKAARFHPLGVMYLAGYLRHLMPNTDFSIFDSNVELPLYYREHPELIDAPDIDPQKVLAQALTDHFKDFQPSVVGISGLFHSIHNQFHHLAKVANDVLPDTPVMVGGPYPSGSPELVLNDPAIDYVVKGEGEFDAYCLLKHMFGEADIDSVGDVFVRGKDGAPVEIKRKEGIETIPYDLDAEIYPARDLLKQHEYTGVSSERSDRYLWRKDHPVTAMYSSRGCPMRCSYCNSGTANYYGPKFRWQSVESVVAEIRHCIDKFGIKEMQFYDENITANPKHTLELYEALNALPVDWTFVTLELERLTKPILKEYVRKKKYSWFSVGMESGNDRVLKEIAWRRATTTSMTEQMFTLREAMTHECFVNASFIVGFPGETIPEVLDTVVFAQGVGIDWAAFFCFMPFPGATLHKWVVQQGYLDLDTIDYGDMCPERSVLNTPNWTSRQMTFLRNWANYLVNFVSNKNISNHTDKAVRGFEYVLSVAPNHLFAYYALGRCHVQLASMSKAEEYFRKAKALIDTEPYSRFVRMFDMPEIGVKRDLKLVGVKSTGNYGVNEPVTFYLPAEFEAAVQNKRSELEVLPLELAETARSYRTNPVGS